MTGFLKYLLVLPLGILLSGCTLLKPTPAVTLEPPAPAVQEVVNANHPAFEPLSAYYYYIESQLQMRRGFLDQAAELLRQALTLDPDSLFLRRELTIIHLQQQRPLEALEIISEAVARQPDDVDSLILYGRIQHSLGEVDEAVAAFEQVLEIDSSQLNFYLILGEIYWEQNALEDAQRIYQQLISLFPHSAAGHFHLGRLQRLVGNPEQARHHLRQSIRLQPDQVEARLELLELDRDRADHSVILKHYEEILEIDPRNVAVLAALGLYLRQQGAPEGDRILADLGTRSRDEATVIRDIFQLYLDSQAYPEARIILEGMLAGDPRNSDLHFLMGLAYTGLEQTDAAITHFKQVERESRFYQNAVLQIALWYQDHDQPEEAIARLEAARHYLDDTLDLKLYLGILYTETERYGQAETVLKEALELDPQNARLYFRLGVVYDKLDDKQAVIDAMQRSLELDDTDAYTLNYLGYTFAELNINLDEAKELILRAMTLKPDDGYITDSLGWVYFKQGDYESALKYLKIAAELLPSDPTVLEHLGDTHYQLENFRQALNYYQQALEHNPDDLQKLQQKIKYLEQRLISDNHVE